MNLGSNPSSPATSDLQSAPGEPARILLIEDEEPFARAVRKRLLKAGFHCEIVATLAAGQQYCRTFSPDLILLDMRLPDGSGLDFLASLREQRSEVPVLVLSAYGEIEDAVAAMKLNAADYLKKPIDLEELIVAVNKVLATASMSRQLHYSRARERHASEGVVLLGDDPKITAIRDQISHIGGLCKTLELNPPTVLITGETGTGKDLVARLLLQSSVRRERPFVHVDCAAFPKDLIEAELFGHERGAFTSALQARTGLIEAAEDGVLFLDEIGEIPLELQAKLLAVLERRMVRRVGSTQERPVAAWFIAATNRTLEKMVKDGVLRSDLYFRLNVLNLNMPPLRERSKDVGLLAKTFAAQTARRYGLLTPKILPETLAALSSYPWPGNVRELKHIVERAVLLSQGEAISPIALQLNTELLGPVSDSAWESLSLAEAERLLIERALARTQNNVSEAARQLGITRMAMRYRMRQYGLGKRTDETDTPEIE